MATIDSYQNQWWSIQKILDQGGLTANQIADYQAQQSELHRLAELQRAQFGYSGGVAGDEIIVLADERFKQTFSDQALMTDGYKSIISNIESGVSSILESATGGNVTLPDAGGIADIAITAVIGLFLLRLIKGVFK